MDGPGLAEPSRAIYFPFSGHPWSPLPEPGASRVRRLDLARGELGAAGPADAEALAQAGGRPPDLAEKKPAEFLLFAAEGRWSPVFLFMRVLRRFSKFFFRFRMMVGSCVFLFDDSGVASSFCGEKGTNRTAGKLNLKRTLKQRHFHLDEAMSLW